MFGFQHAAKCERRCDIPQFTFTVHTDLPRPPIRNLSSGFLQSESGPNSGGKQDCDPDLPVELANAPVNQADGIEEALVAELWRVRRLGQHDCHLPGIERSYLFNVLRQLFRLLGDFSYIIKESIKELGCFYISLVVLLLCLLFRSFYHQVTSTSSLLFHF